jgi:hypothetical protein
MKQYFQLKSLPNGFQVKLVVIKATGVSTIHFKLKVCTWAVFKFACMEINKFYTKRLKFQHEIRIQS